MQPLNIPPLLLSQPFLLSLRSLKRSTIYCVVFTDNFLRYDVTVKPAPPPRGGAAGVKDENTSSVSLASVRSLAHLFLFGILLDVCETQIPGIPRTHLAKLQIEISVRGLRTETTACRKRRLHGAVSRNNRLKRMAPCQSLDGHVKEHYEMSMALGAQP